MRHLVFLLALTVVCAPLIGGCSSPDSVPKLTGDEKKLMDEVNNQTPEQQIERIKNGPMPESAKAAMIDKIKKEHGLQ